MRWENVYVAGLGAYLPREAVKADDAVAAGLYDAGEHEANGIREVRIAGEGEAPAEMAAAAGRQAVQRSGHAPEDFGLVLHACCAHQGQDFWTPASFVQREAGAGTGAAIEIRQGSNGGPAALELAASWITSRPDTPAALITTGDSFKLPYFNRWTTDDQQIYGDGAGAVVLSTTGGFAKLRSTASVGDPSLEPIYRGGDAWTDAPFYDGKPGDMRARKHAYLMQNPNGYEEAIERIGRNFGGVLHRALTDADTTLPDTQWFVHANVGQTVADWGFYGQLGLDPKQTTYEWGKDYGHMGAGDQLIGLNHLIETGRPKPGDLIVTVGAGIGFMWTVAVLEVVDVPQW